LTRVAVVGHVERVIFAAVERLPAPGDIVHARETWEEAAGGGGVAAVQLARLAGGCTFLTACDRAAAEDLRALGVTVHSGERPTRRAFTHTEDSGERTITVLDERVIPVASDPLPWEALGEADAVYFTAGDAEAARAARAARVMVATPRAAEALAGAGDVEVDVLVLSGNDIQEMAWADGLPARHRVLTDGARGGRWTGRDGEGRWAAAPLPGPVVDAYGCGDSFAAGLTYGLARGDGLDAALELAARCGAACLTGKGPYGADLRALT
jgi:ribokinase